MSRRAVVERDATLSGVTWIGADEHRPRPWVGVLGSIHGNERCGSQALEWLAAELESGSLAMASGTVVLIHGNLDATLANRRYTQGGTDMNRLFDFAFVEALAPSRWSSEHQRVAALRPVLEELDVMLDVHSATSRTRPFAIPNPVPESLELAARLGLDTVAAGWDAPGLLMDRVSIGLPWRRGRVGIAVECGQHEAPTTFEVARQVMVRFLQGVGALAGAPPPRAEVSFVRVMEAIGRPSPSFKFTRPIEGMTRLGAGEVIGRDRLSELRASSACWAVLPNDSVPVGEDMIYLAVDA